jgi:patatin-like phospholipase/acyl hydrolase
MQSVSEARTKYEAFSRKVFSRKSDDAHAAFDEKVLEQEFKNVVATAIPGGQSTSAQLKDTRPGACRTFVIATSLDAGGAVRMRSFSTRDAESFSGCIWQAARATSAAPTYFLPIEIDNVRYGDGGLMSNNPTKEAIAEARNIWPTRPIGIVVSIGTGIEPALQLKDKAKGMPGIVQKLIDNTFPEYGFKFAVAQYAVECITSCEITHEEVLEHCDREILGANYFRLNVPQGVSSFGLDEWQKLGEMIALTNRYMDREKKREKRKIAELLENPGVAAGN